MLLLEYFRNVLIARVCNKCILNTPVIHPFIFLNKFLLYLFCVYFVDQKLEM